MKLSTKITLGVLAVSHGFYGYFKVVRPSLQIMEASELTQVCPFVIRPFVRDFDMFPMMLQSLLRMAEQKN